MILIIDNHDSFVYNIYRYIKEIKYNVMVVNCDEISLQEIEQIRPTGIIISPGPKSPQHKDCYISNEIINQFKQTYPILGICLGMQCIAHCFGSNIVQAEKPIHGKVSSIIHDGKTIFKKLPSTFNVTRYHSLIVDKDSISSQLEITSTASDGVIMGIRHKSFQIEGVQFHPEAHLTQYGHEIFKNFVETLGEQNA